MTKKFGKKLLSIILSILMVVTTLPLTAITASAYPSDVINNEHLVAQYLVDDCTTGITVHNVDWDSQKRKLIF